MKTSNFFSSTEMASILSQPKPGSLVILDIDDTIGRVPQTIGLDSWFHYRMQQYANEGHPESQALLNTIAIYNLAQLASTQLVPVDKDINIAELINGLKNQGTKVIALTARNDALVDKTLSLLKTMNVFFCDDVLNDGSFSLNNKPVVIQNGVIFANGNHKGDCLEHTHKQGYFVAGLFSYNNVDFIDDKKKNCLEMIDSLTKLDITHYSVCHYTYAEMFLALQEKDMLRATIQEDHLLKHGTLLTDEAAEQQWGCATMSM